MEGEVLDPNERFKGQTVETQEWKGKSEVVDEDAAKKKWVTRILGWFISLFIGFYAGLSCKTVMESAIYGSLFAGEAGICACLVSIGGIKSISLANSFRLFSEYFLVAAVSTPLTAYLFTNVE